nr:protein-ADP-ribose hydrolase [uncultured Oscillibacter sp.]
MERMEKIRYLNGILLREMPEYCGQAAEFPLEDAAQRRLLRSLMNLRPPAPLDPGFLRVQDELLSQEREAKGVVDGEALPAAAPGISLWQGDITRLAVDAIVDADNSGLLGCFHPCHGCVDNAIHSAAGLQLREECHELMKAQGGPEPAGRAKITRGYNLPARYVLHTVGPVVRGRVTRRDREELASCYRSCLELAAEKDLRSVAFCCISTGEFHFPNREAAEIAVKTAAAFLRRDTSVKKVIFNVFKDMDAQIYRELLGEH